MKFTIKELMFILICVLLLSGCTNQYSSKSLAEKDYLVYGQLNIDNYDLLLNFIDLYNKKQNSELKIAVFTDEGDPILHKISFSDNVITYSYDSTHDDNGYKEKLETTCSDLIRENNLYVLKNCENNSTGEKLRIRLKN